MAAISTKLVLLAFVAALALQPALGLRTLKVCIAL